MPLTLAGNGTITGADWGTSGAGLVKITTQSFTSASSVSVDNCFTSTYDNYRILVSATSSTTSVLYARPRLGGTDSTDNASWRYLRTANFSTATTGTATNAFMRWDVNNAVTEISQYVVDLFGPAVAAVTQYLATSHNGAGMGLSAGVHSATTAYDGLTIYPSTGTISGTLTVYGYTK